MESNRLSLSCNKTEVVWCVPSRRPHQLLCSALSVDGTQVKPVRSARDLGDQRFQDTGGQPLCANSFGLWQQCLAGFPVYLVRRLQLVLNAAARLTYHSHTAELRRSDHISDELACFHWLRIPERIAFKIAVMTYKVVHGFAPGYLGPFTHAADLPSRRLLHSVDTNHLVVLTSRLSAVGSELSSVAGP